MYKEAIPIEEAFEIIKEESGIHFDPRLVDVFLSDKEKYVEISKLKWNWSGYNISHFLSWQMHKKRV